MPSTVVPGAIVRKYSGPSVSVDTVLLSRSQMKSLSYLGFTLDEAARLYVRRVEERARDFALEPMACKTLLVLAENAGVTQQRLAELTMLEPVAVGRILERLETKGLVRRRRRPGDGRARSVALTREAMSLLPRLWQAAKESLREALTGMSTTEKRVLKDALQHVLQNLSVGAAH
jgi:MarR family transcriptional regulator, transcriptional regulator for hemolysin